MPLLMRHNAHRCHCARERCMLTFANYYTKCKGMLGMPLVLETGLLGPTHTHTCRTLRLVMTAGPLVVSSLRVLQKQLRWNTSQTAAHRQLLHPRAFWEDNSPDQKGVAGKRDDVYMWTWKPTGLLDVIAMKMKVALAESALGLSFVEVEIKRQSRKLRRNHTAWLKSGIVQRQIQRALAFLRFHLSPHALISLAEQPIRMVISPPDPMLI